MADSKMNYEEAGRFLGLKTGTLHAYVSRRQIPHLRIGPRLVRFDRHELEAWLDSKRVTAR